MGEENSAPTPAPEKQNPVCEFCGESQAVVYCRADSARLCLACDRHVHCANTVSSKHPRSLLCDSCMSAPSSLLCCSPHQLSGLSGLLLCSNCDFELHNLKPSSCDGQQHHHDRRPVEPFSGCPSAADLVSAFGVGGDEALLKKSKDAAERNGGEEEGVKMGSLQVWETGQVVRLDDLIVPTTTAASHPFQFQAIGIPPLPKNRNLACGRQKDEILRQLHELIASETQLFYDQDEDEAETEAPVKELLQYFLPDNCDQHDSLLADFNANATFQVTQNSEPAGEIQWDNIDWHNATNTEIFPSNFDDGQFGSSSAPISDYQTSTSNNIDVVHHTGIVKEDASQQITPKGGVEPLVCPDRDSVLSRYKEKRKTRRYDKLIRYESRKARADSRMRIKGRFAKAINQVPNA